MKFTMYSGFSDRLARDGAETVAHLAAEAGFSAVELLEYLIDDREFVIPDIATAKKVKEELNRQGLTVACYSAVANVWQNTTTEETFKRALDIAAALETPYFHHTLLPWLRPPMDAPAHKEGIQMAVEAAARVADYAKTLGIVCIYEDQGRYVNGISGFGDFYWELKKRCTNVGVCLDLGNILFVNETPEAFLRAFKDEIRHVHVKDYLQMESAEYPGKPWWHAEDNVWLCDAEVGTGIVDFKTCFRLLNEIGYNGTYSLENSSAEPFRENAQKTMAYLRKVAEDN